MRNVAQQLRLNGRLHKDNRSLEKGGTYKLGVERRGVGRKKEGIRR